MSLKLLEEPDFDNKKRAWIPKPRKTKRYNWFVIAKKQQKRRERQRARKDVECNPEYGRYTGWY